MLVTKYKYRGPYLGLGALLPVGGGALGGGDHLTHGV